MSDKLFVARFVPGHQNLRAVFLTTTEPPKQVGQLLLLNDAHLVAAWLSANWPELAELARQGVV